MPSTSTLPDDPFATLAEALLRDEEGAGPKSPRLAATLRALVDDGRLRAGDKLPNEIDLATRSGFSLGTVQKALRVLADGGVLDRRHGHGTFVAGGDHDRRDLWYFRFVSDTGAELTPVTARALDRRVLSEPGPWNAFLDSDSVILVRRLLDVGGMFSVLSDVYVDARRFAGLLDLPLDDFDRVALRNLLYERFGAPTYHASQRIWCDRLPEAARLLLGVPGGSFGLMSDVFSRTSRDAPISMQRIYVPPGVSPLDIRG